MSIANMNFARITNRIAFNDLKVNLNGPFKKANPDRYLGPNEAPFLIYRDMFIDALNKEPMEYKIDLTVEYYYDPGEAASYGYYGGHPDSPQTIETMPGGFEVYSINDFELTKEDAAIVKAAIGDLTKDEWNSFENEMLKLIQSGGLHENPD
jgi:hypothetical protein